MKIKWGALVVDGRGKLGGHVLAKNRSGAVMRTKVTPVNGRTSFQQNVRNKFTTIAQAWRGLTQSQRDAWNAAVAAFAKTDIFGDLRNPSGITLYQRLNNNLLQAGQALITTPPTPAALAVVTATVLAYNPTGSILTLTTSAATPAGSMLKITATAPQSAGKSFIAQQLRVLAYNATSYAAGVSIKTIYEAKFGASYPVGTKIFVQATVINIVTGQAGVPSQVQVVLT